MKAIQYSPSTLGVADRQLAIWGHASTLRCVGLWLWVRVGMLLSAWTEATGSVDTVSSGFKPGYHVRWVSGESKEISWQLSEQSPIFSPGAHTVVASVLPVDSR